MEVKPSRYDQGTNIRKVDLANNLIIHFQKRGKYKQNLPSYEQIEGKKPTFVKYSSILENTCSPVENNSKNSETAVEKTKELIGIIYHIQNKKGIKIASRNYMLLGRTKPIRIQANNKKCNKTFYVKKPSNNRLFGNLLYNTFSEFDNNVFYFNQKVFIEDEIKGQLLTDENKKYFLKNQAFKESAIKLKVQDDLISINDLDKRSNAIIVPEGKVRAFDFDTLFIPREEQVDFLTYLREQERFDISQKLEKKITQEERTRLRSVYSQNKSAVDKLFCMIDRIPEIRENIHLLGFESGKDYIKQKISRLR